MRRNTIICDLDGTLADVRHRSHMVNKEGGSDWTAYSMECGDDKPIEGVNQAPCLSADRRPGGDPHRPVGPGQEADRILAAA